jgi:hypothetical protein
MDTIKLPSLVIQKCKLLYVEQMKHKKGEMLDFKIVRNLPSSSESDIKVSCIASGATTRYFSSFIEVDIAASELVTGFNESKTLM